MGSKGGMTPVKGLAAVGCMMIILSGFSLWIVTNQSPSSPGLGAVEFSEVENNSIKVTVIETGSADAFVAESQSGEKVVIQAESGNSRTLEDVNSITVYVISDGERTEINSHTANETGS